MAEALAWHLGDVVRKLREMRQFKSQEALGIAAGGLDKGTINRLETRGEEGSTPDTIKRVADALHVEVSDLYALVPVPRLAWNAPELKAAWDAIPETARASALELLRRYSQIAEDQIRTPLQTPATPATATGNNRGTKKA